MLGRREDNGLFGTKRNKTGAKQLDGTPPLPRAACSMLLAADSLLIGDNSVTPGREIVSGHCSS